MGPWGGIFLQDEVKVSRGATRFTIHVKFICLLTTFWTPFRLLLMIPDKFHESWDKCSCSELCILELITASTNDAPLLITSSSWPITGPKHSFYSLARKLTNSTMNAHSPYARGCFPRCFLWEKTLQTGPTKSLIQPTTWLMSEY